MRAIIKTKSGIDLTQRFSPDFLTRGPDAHEVVLKVSVVGLCRTDIQFANGEIPGANGTVLGHEFCARVEKTGTQVEHLKPGDLVTALPLIPCHQCDDCRGQNYHHCHRHAFLGTDRHGALAERICLPAYLVYCVPGTMDPCMAAYAEPLASAMSVLDAKVDTNSRVLVYGHSRIASLIQDMMTAFGYCQVDMACTAATVRRQYDAVVDAGMSDDDYKNLAAWMRPQALLLVKSRRPGCLTIPLAEFQRKRLRMIALNYAPFSRAVDLLTREPSWIKRLIGPVYAMADYAAAFQQAAVREHDKVFIQVT